jgi:hypothetical protein
MIAPAPMTDLLEISAWPWLEAQSRAEGRRVALEDVPARAWDALAHEGFDTLYLMGVWRRSAIGRAIALAHEGLRGEYDRLLPGWGADDVAGSPFSIAAYEPDPRMGGWPGLDAARAELRARDMRLMLDFVPNHTAFDHPWVAEFPDRYVLASPDDYERAPAAFRQVTAADGRRVAVACGRDPYFDPWTDVAQLNYFNPETRAAMIATLGAIAEHCDAVRCDMAMLALNEVFSRTWGHLVTPRWPRPDDEFWPVATRQVSGLTYVAEVYWDLESTLLGHGFHYAYDKRLLDALHDGHAGPRVRGILAARAPAPERLVRFVENHDEARSAESLDGRLEAAAALVATLPGMRFFFDGQLDGRRTRPPVQLGRWPDEPPDEAVRRLYTRVRAFAAAAAVRDGVWKPLDVAPAGDDTFDHIVAYRWRARDDRVVVAVNPGKAVAQALVVVDDDFAGPGAWTLDDAMDGRQYAWNRDSAQTPLFVRLEPGRAHLFKVLPAPHS